ncbi:imelysin family protein [Parapedobacter koreensis]|uniref:Predicted lipoprotein n=1 Tax=Parapedobacter koreensis TaxID=332977 RepID=A0A1H7JRC0_9SPHI|nr:imelysin family protein [Parapedobacter koreensis]SEK77072.1 Predicted lipoprotein [Parapedobacter koreensis]
MKTKAITFSCLLATVLFITLSCSKDDDGNDGTDDIALQEEILAQVATNVCEDSYIDMHAKAVALNEAITTLNGTTTDANLAAAQAAWRDIRTTWERTESWLFGPIDADEIDPRIDTWPVDFNDLDGILANGDELTEAYIDGLEESLKGFHPIEYLLWGENGNKTAAQFTDREKAYLSALGENLTKLSADVKDTWQNGYTQELANAGRGSSEFATRQEAFLQLVDAMAGICDEVANAKIKEPFDAADPTLEESPFAKNSFTDFKNNITGILLMYQGKFNTDGKGLEDLVRTHNLSLDAEIKANHAAAIAALDAFNVPFGEAITTRQSDIQNAMDKINALATTLEGKLNPFVLQYVR